MCGSRGAWPTGRRLQWDDNGRTELTGVSRSDTGGRRGAKSKEGVLSTLPRSKS